MLARANRIVHGDDYRRIVRRGRRTSTPNAVVYRIDASGGSVRFGFIVAKSVGNSVVRNRVRRRLKVVAAEQLPKVASGTDFVIRALPGSATASWVTLRMEITDALDTGTRA